MSYSAMNMKIQADTQRIKYGEKNKEKNSKQNEIPQHQILTTLSLTKHQM